MSFESAHSESKSDPTHETVTFFLYNSIKTATHSSGKLFTNKHKSVSYDLVICLGGKLSLSFLVHLSWVNTKLLYAVCVFLTGAVTILWGFWVTPVGMVTCASLFGLFNASIGGIAIEVAYLLSGSELFSVVYGYCATVCALGWMAGAPIAGNIPI